jgi:hypothetical protein
VGGGAGHNSLKEKVLIGVRWSQPNVEGRDTDCWFVGSHGNNISETNSRRNKDKGSPKKSLKSGDSSDICRRRISGTFDKNHKGKWKKYLFCLLY